jgi:hypothetical protein
MSAPPNSALEQAASAAHRERYREQPLRDPEMRQSATYVALLPLITLLVAAVSPSQANPVSLGPGVDQRFRSELVRLNVAPGLLTVTGTYRFDRMMSQGNNPIVFPIIRDSTMVPPELVSAVIQCGSKSPQPLDVLHVLDKWWAWYLPGTPEDRFCSVTLTYTQKLNGFRAGYLLTSAGLWTAPPDSMRIEVILSAALKHPVFSLPVTLISQDAMHSQYFIVFRHAFPKDNMRVTWDAD